MKIPKNMTEDQVVDIITKVAHRLAPKFTFAFYETEDIEQDNYINFTKNILYSYLRCYVVWSR